MARVTCPLIGQMPTSCCVVDGVALHWAALLVVAIRDRLWKHSRGRKRLSPVLHPATPWSSGTTPEQAPQLTCDAQSMRHFLAKKSCEGEAESRGSLSFDPPTSAVGDERICIE